ncbi:hypothetical protein Fuma_00801 [Fuerstiella marisgermanici]|uniref:Uncharacterized protein n=2 Tax=Fuerstiella marisgermanici TaxID=1891926 RepID=A0A1P8WAZ1_9PLAN|nr:hypothetical protein Fuma_00801 [Fuerstiella marisgermanici]
MFVLATTYTPRPGLIGFSSAFAFIAVSLLAYVVRVVPDRQKEGLTILAPYLLLFIPLGFSLNTRFLDIQHHVALFIYFASAFGFSLHNFTFPHRANYVTGVISGFLTGLLLTFIGASYAFASGPINTDNDTAFWLLHVAFILLWFAFSTIVFARQSSAAGSIKDRDGDA